MSARDWHVIFACSLGLALSASFVAAAAQDGPEVAVAPDPEDTVYRTGSLLAPADVIQALPKTRKFRGFLPDIVDLRRHFPRPGDQGEQNSCVGWAVGYAARGYYSSAADGLTVTRAENVPSPSYIYNLSLSERSGADCLAGMIIPKAFAILEQGAVSLAQMPYDPSSCRMSDPGLRQRANQFRIRESRSIDPHSLDTIKGELANGHPVIFNMTVGMGFMAHRGGGVFRIPLRDETPVPDGQLNSHAMVIVGYDEARQAVRIINSWGPGWGEKGYAWIGYDTFSERVREAYTIRPLGRDPVPAQQPAPQPEPVLPTPQPIPPIAELQPAPQPEPVLPTPQPIPLIAEPKPVPPNPATVVQDLGLACAKVTLVSGGGKQIARGFVAKPEDIAHVKERLKDSAIEVELDVRPWPQCEALLTLDRALDANDRPLVTIRGTSNTLKKGDQLIIDVVSPRAPAHLHVAYIQADGSVVHLVQSDAKHLRTVDSAQALVFGDGLGGRERFIVRAPFGPELIVALASRAPLFPEPRPQSETERDFLTTLRKALLWKPDASAPDRAVSAAIAAIVTTEN